MAAHFANDPDKQNPYASGQRSTNARAVQRANGTQARQGAVGMNSALPSMRTGQAQRNAYAQQNRTQQTRAAYQANTSRNPYAAAGNGGRGGNGNGGNGNGGNGGRTSNPYMAYNNGGMPKKKKSKAPWIILAIVLVLAVVGGVFGYSLYGSAKELKAQASTVVSSVDTLKDNLTGGAYEDAANTAANMQVLSSQMQVELQKPIWTVASHIPVIGSDVTGVRDVADVLVQLCDEVLVPMTDKLRGMSSEGIMRADGSFDTDAISNLLTVVEQTAPTMQSCADKIASVPTMHISQLESTMSSAKEKFAKINDLYQQGAGLAPVAGKLLGIEGDRNYLLVAQNTVETRSNGGFPGAVGMLTISNGKISMGDFGTPYDLFSETTSVSFTEEEQNIFGVAWYDFTNPRDSGIITDFTRVAAIWADAYMSKTGNSINGVVSVAPSVVQDLLAATGQSVTLSDGTYLDGTNATKVIESDIYWKYYSADTVSDESNDICDALFAEAAEGAFKAVMGNLSMSNIKGILEVMLNDVEEGTFYVWLLDSEEQSQIASLNCSGALNTDPTKPEIGVYIGNIPASKLGWYLDVDTQVGEGVKNADGTTSYNVTVTVHNALDSATVEAANPYIIGNYNGKLRPLMYFSAPAGGSITNFTPGSDEQALVEGTYQGLQYLGYGPVLECEGTQTYTYTVTTSAEATEPLTVYQTPTLTKYRQ